MADYSQQWSNFRMWRRIGGAILAGFIACSTWVLIALDGKPNEDRIEFFVVVGFGLALLAVGLKLNAFKCPRCGKQFLPPYWRRRDMIGKKSVCYNCGLPRDANG